MNLQSIKYIAVLAAAVFIPYQFVREGRNAGDPSPVGNWWNAIVKVEGDPGTIDVRSSPNQRGGAPWITDVSPRDFDRPAYVPEATSGLPASFNRQAVPFAGVPDSTAAAPGPFVRSLAEILRFDIQPSWVIQQFPQVWRQSAGDNLDAYRATLLSGTRPADVAGALTYFFDRNSTLQRISLDGKTGDPSELIGIASQYFGLRPESELGSPFLVLRNEKRDVVSILHIQPNAWIRQSQPFHRYQVALELNRPGPNVALSESWSDIPGIVAKAVDEQASTSTSERSSHLHEGGPTASGIVKKDASHGSSTRPRRSDAFRLMPHSR